MLRNSIHESISVVYTDEENILRTAMLAKLQILNKIYIEFLPKTESKNDIYCNIFCDAGLLGRKNNNKPIQIFVDGSDMKSIDAIFDSKGLVYESPVYRKLKKVI